MQMILPATTFSKWFVGRRCQTGTVRRHELGRRKVLSSSFPEVGTIHCVRGLLWITRDGGADDIFLSDGDSLVCDRRDRVVVEALEEAVVEISEIKV
jgi:hypothetical protein